MATRLRRWILIVGGSCTVLALWLLPPRPTPLTSDWASVRPERTPERATAERLGAEAHRLSRVLKLARLADSLGAWVVSAEPEVGPVVISLPPGVVPEERERIRALATRAVEGGGPRDRDMVVGVLMVDDHYGNPPAFPEASFGNATEYMAGVREGRPFCLVVRSYWESDRFDLSDRRNPVNFSVSRLGRGGWGASYSSDDLLGPCAFYLAYGPPGDGTESWLRDAGMLLLARHRLGEPDEPQAQAHRGVFGRWLPGPLGSAAGEGCLAGSAEACRAAVTSAPPDRVSYVEVPSWIYAADVPYVRPLFNGFENGFEAYWMRDLEAALGTDRFARFWRSDLPVEDAFSGAAGESIGDWTMRWAQELLGRQRASPSVDGPSILLTALTILACAAAATTTGVRRRG